MNLTVVSEPNRELLIHERPHETPIIAMKESKHLMHAFSTWAESGGVETHKHLKFSSPIRLTEQANEKLPLRLTNDGKRNVPCSDASKLVLFVEGFQREDARVWPRKIFIQHMMWLVQVSTKLATALALYFLQVSFLHRRIYFREFRLHGNLYHFRLSFSQIQWQ